MSARDDRAEAMREACAEAVREIIDSIDDKGLFNKTEAACIRSTLRRAVSRIEALPLPATPADDASGAKPVAWAVRDRHGQYGEPSRDEAKIRRDCDYLNRDSSTPYYIGQGPYEVVPLAPLPATDDAVEEAARAVAYICAECGALWRKVTLPGETAESWNMVSAKGCAGCDNGPRPLLDPLYRAAPLPGGDCAMDEAVRQLVRDAARAGAIDAPDDKNYSGFTEKDAERCAEQVLASMDDDIRAALRRAHGGPPERSDGGHEAQGRGGA